jgi:hypothetical protein
MMNPMRTVGSLWWQLVALGPFLALAQCCAQGTFTRITFDGPPAQPRGTQYFVEQYYEGGMSFTPIDPNAPRAGFTRNGGGISGYPENGSAYLQAGLTDTLRFNSMNGSFFDLVSVDLAGYSDVVPDATVRFVGYRNDGSLVAADITVHGLSFQTFSFDSSFTTLGRVEIPTIGWSLDNLGIRVPEPGAGTLVAIGGTLFGLRFLRRRKHSQKLLL